MGIFEALHRFRIIPFLKKWYVFNILLGLLDILAITAAYQLSFSIYYDTWSRLFITENQLLYIYLAVMPVWLIVLYFINITQIPRTKRYRVLFLEYLQSAILIIVVIVFIYFSFRLYMVPRQFLGIFVLIGFILLLFLRIFEYRVFRNYRARGYNYKNLVLICDENAYSFIKKVLTNTEWGYRFLVIFSDSEKIAEEFSEEHVIQPLSNLDSLHSLMEKYLVDEVVYYRDKVSAPEVRNIIRSCEELGITFNMHIENGSSTLSNAIRTRFAEENFLTFVNIPYKVTSLIAKRFMDISVSLTLILLLAPFMLFIEIAIRLSSKGPAIFKQKRVGLRGREFNMYKFRTMIVGAENMQEELAEMNEVDGPAFKMENDPRVTRIGKFLRRTGLDELPQLFNILRGEMSLIGPRPALKSEVEKYKRWQLRRLSVRPGLSCFWQIKPQRSKIKFEKWMEMDLAYIDNWSFRLDMIILFRTLRAFLHV